MDSYEVGCHISDIFNVYKEGSSYIAGGYLRDMDLGREPKDVDVLVEYGSDKDLEEGIRLADRFGYTCERVGGNYGEIGKDLHTVFALEKPGELKIDLVFLNVPCLPRIHDFPCNLCQIYRIGLTGIIAKSEEYEEGVASKMIVYNPDQIRENYYNKMLRYFPDWDHILIKPIKKDKVPFGIGDLPLARAVPLVADDPELWGNWDDNMFIGDDGDIDVV
jgi:hypothetical protein